MSDDFVFGDEGGEASEVAKTSARPEKASLSKELAERAEESREIDTCYRESTHIQAMYENTRVPLPLIAAQFNLRLSSLKVYAGTRKWVNPRTAEENNATGPVVDPGLDENGNKVRKLTDQQRVAVDEYLASPTLNKSAAARAAGFKTTGVFELPIVQEAVDTALTERSERTKITQDEVLLELERLAKANISDYLSWDERGALTFVPSSKLTDDQKAGIISISQGRNGTRVELAKVAAIKMLGQHLGMFVDRLEADHRVAVIMTEIDADL